MSGIYLRWPAAGELQAVAFDAEFLRSPPVTLGSLLQRGV